MITIPIKIFWVFGRVGNIALQKMIIRPRQQKLINAVTPKISKNRLLSDFCLLLLDNMFCFCYSDRVNAIGTLYATRTGRPF